MTLKLYGTAKSRAMRNLWLLFEIGQPFEHVDIVQIYNRTRDEQVTCRDEAFLKINPNGHIPALEDDGLVLWESLAINLHLARRFGGDLGPADLREEGLMSMWSLWAANECEGEGLALMQNRVAKPPEQRDAARAAAAVEALKAPFAVLDGELAHGPHLVGNRLTVADINVACVLNYARSAPELFAAAPRVRNWFETLTARPAFQRVMKMREA